MRSKSGFQMLSDRFNVIADPIEHFDQGTQPEFAVAGKSQTRHNAVVGKPTPADKQMPTGITRKFRSIVRRLGGLHLRHRFEGLVQA